MRTALVSVLALLISVPAFAVDGYYTISSYDFSKLTAISLPGKLKPVKQNLVIWGPKDLYEGAVSQAESMLHDGDAISVFHRKQVKSGRYIAQIYFHLDAADKVDARSVQLYGPSGKVGVGSYGSYGDSAGKVAYQCYYAYARLFDAEANTYAQYSMPAGNYTLKVTYGNGSSRVLPFKVVTPVNTPAW